MHFMLMAIGRILSRLPFLTPRYKKRGQEFLSSFKLEMSEKNMCSLAAAAKGIA